MGLTILPIHSPSFIQARLKGVRRSGASQVVKPVASAAASQTIVMAKLTPRKTQYAKAQAKTALKRSPK